MSKTQNKLLKLQLELNAPKSRFNSFGNYNYRSLEDILEAVKPLLDKYGLYLKITDELVQVGDRYYVKSTSAIYDTSEGDFLKPITESTAYAREPEEKKGMDSAQVSGSTSSYSRKYSLNSLLLLDDVKDPDTDEHHIQTNQKSDDEKKWLGEGGDGKKSTTQEEFVKVEEAVKSGKIKAGQLRQYYKVSKATQDYFNSLGA
jgi:hypothetical protein